MTQPNTTANTAGPAAPAGSSTAPAAPAKVRWKKPLLWAATACCGLVAVKLAMNGAAPQAPARLPDPVASSQVVPVPSKAATDRAQTATTATATNVIPTAPAAKNSASLDAIAPPSGAESEGARYQQTDPVEHERSKEILEALQRNADTLVNLEQSVVELKEQMAKLSSVPKRPAKAISAVAPTRTVPAPSRADPDSAQLLSIDLWGGKPSVVVGRKRGDGAEVTFLNEGEKQGRVTVKRADVDSQRAILATDRGDVVLSREE
ncbi:hypothetical protein [Janthinobacterium sp. BJB446]|uniref:hypothetical protein n=1 Tax=Janthinobacterium sp. BJB446 TaxID=2048009 RepID=UPI00117B52A3|nr:hypothetical protein [Janthinobacterium sp. BJB446]